MFSHISWTLYFQMVGVLLVLYYATVLLLYFRNDVLSPLVSRQKGSLVGFIRMSRKPAPAAERQPNAQSEGTLEGGNSYNLLIGALCDEIDAFLAEAGKAGFTREQILGSLLVLLEKYTSVRTSPYKTKIGHFIAEACRTHTAIVLSEQEIERLLAE